MAIEASTHTWTHTAAQKQTHTHRHTGTQMVSGGINKCRVGPPRSGVTAAYAAYFGAHGEKLSNCRTRPKKVSLGSKSAYPFSGSPTRATLSPTKPNPNSPWAWWPFAKRLNLNWQNIWLWHTRPKLLSVTGKELNFASGKTRGKRTLIAR